MATEMESGCPIAVKPAKVGHYPLVVSRNDGRCFYDDLLEYRVWVHNPTGDDVYMAFPTFEQSLQYSNANSPHAEFPLALVRQTEWITEPNDCMFLRKTGERIVECLVSNLKKRTENSIPDFLCTREPA